MTGDEGSSQQGSEPAFNLAAFGTIAYLFVCCVALPLTFGSAFLSAGSLLFGAPEWLIVGSGAIGVALGLWSVARRTDRLQTGP